MKIIAKVRHQSSLWSSLGKTGVKTTQEFLDRADKFIKLQEALSIRENQHQIQRRTKERTIMGRAKVESMVEKEEARAMEKGFMS